jgi:hypothetical protein
VLLNLLGLVRVGGLLKTVTQDVLPLVREARKVVETSRRRTPDSDGASLEELRSRLDRLEASNSRQAELIEGLSRSVENLSRGLQVAARGVRVLLAVTVAAVVLAAAALAVVLLG